MFMTVASQTKIDYDTVKTLQSEAEFRREYCEGWDETVWKLPTKDGELPTFQ
jgi:hypothetical protein